RQQMVLKDLFGALLALFAVSIAYGVTARARSFVNGMQGNCFEYLLTTISIRQRVVRFRRKIAPKSDTSGWTIVVQMGDNLRQDLVTQLFQFHGRIGRALFRNMLRLHEGPW